MWKICIFCKKQFKKKYSYSQKYFKTQKFCSIKCHSLARIGKRPYIMTEKQKKMISKSLKGKKLSEETKKRISIALSGSKSYLWNGGRIKDKDGYILAYMPNHPFSNNKYVREHRLIVEKKIGRYLHTWEVVHHINGIRDDNRIENLRLFSNDVEHHKLAHTPKEYTYKGREKEYHREYARKLRLMAKQEKGSS